MSFTSIQTKMLKPTNHRGDRVKATAMSSWDNKPKPSVTISYDYGMSAEENHRAAAMELLPKVLNKYVIHSVTLITGSCDRGYIFTPVLWSTLAKLPRPKVIIS